MRGVALKETVHRAKGQRNEKFITDLENASLDYKDWIIVAAFYSAIHYVMSYFHRTVSRYDDESNDPLIPDRSGLGRLKGHLHRKALVERHLKKLLRDYNWLETAAWSARYRELDMSQVPPSKIQEVKTVVSTKFKTL